jgi:glycerophosphoryl diester phosphodiesterase
VSGTQVDAKRWSARGAHDFVLDRTTSGSGLVAEHDLTDVRALDAGKWFSAEFTGARVPLLDEVLALEDLDFELELKGFTPQYLDDLLDVVLTAGALERSEFTSWNSLMLQALKAQHPSARVGLFTPRRCRLRQRRHRRQRCAGSHRSSCRSALDPRRRDGSSRARVRDPLTRSGTYDVRHE